MDSPIKDVLEVKDFLMAIGKAVKDALADGKIGLDDLSHLMPAMMLVPNVIKAIPNVGPELKLLPEHMDELVAGVLVGLGVSDPKVSVYVEEGVKMIQSAYRIVQTVKAA